MPYSYSIIPKEVAPSCAWASITEAEVIAAQRNISAFKITFDRKYPYFWINGRVVNFSFGIALTEEVVDRAFDADAGRFILYTDGVLHNDGYNARCIALGNRQSFFILPFINPTIAYNDLPFANSPYIQVSAQDDPVCPFAFTKSF